MKSIHHNHKIKSLILMAALAAATSGHAAGVIYSDSFSGLSTANLNGLAPEVRPGTETWSASTIAPAWKADGAITGANAYRNAFLPFTPQTGKIYILSMDVNITAGGNDWFALGFTAGNGPTDNFANSPINAAPWILERQDAISTDQTIAVTGLNFVGNVAYNLPPGLKALTIVLDTRGTQWKATWYLGKVLLRGTVTYATNPTINYVGFGKYGTATGTVDNFVLSDVTPAKDVIFSHSFSGISATDLNNQMLDAPATVAWSSDGWKADGSITATNIYRNAFIPFTPQAGKIYTLSMDVNVTSGGISWFGFGFAGSFSLNGGFHDQLIAAAPWFLERDQLWNGTRTSAYLGPNTTDVLAYATADGLKTLKIVLSTMGSQWKSTWYVDNVLLRPTVTYTTNPSINYIGVGQNKAVAGTVDNLSLVDSTPPQGTLVSFQ